jgi:hypothetical protein
MSVLKLLLAIAVIAAAVFHLSSGGPIERPPGELAPEAPRQALLQNAAPFQSGDFTLTPQARYTIEARILSIEPYSGDVGAILSPLDFAVGWGAMSDSAVLDHFKITQGVRFYTLYPDKQALDIQAALRLSANMHLIPADAYVKETLEKARPGHIVAMKGYLVRANRHDGFVWNTSLTRDDSGAGACELMYVETASLR